MPFFINYYVKKISFCCRLVFGKISKFLEKQVIRRNFSKSEKNCGMIGETSGNDFGTIPSLHEYRVFTPEVS